MARPIPGCANMVSDCGVEVADESGFETLDGLDNNTSRGAGNDDSLARHCAWFV